MSRNNSTTKNKRTNKHSSSRARRSASDLRDQELLAPPGGSCATSPRRTAVAASGPDTQVSAHDVRSPLRGPGDPSACRLRRIRALRLQAQARSSGGWKGSHRHRAQVLHHSQRLPGLQYRASRPLLVIELAECKMKCRAPAGQVGNVVLLAEVGGQRDWDLLQSLCQPHHDAKTRRGRKAREDPSG